MLRIFKTKGLTIKSKLKYIQFKVEKSNIYYVAQVNPHNEWFVYVIISKWKVLTTKVFKNHPESRKKAIKYAYDLAFKYAQRF